MLRISRLVAISAVAFGAGLVGCAPSSTTVVWEQSGMPKHNTSHFHNRPYQFVYYPGCDVYFEPFTKTYFWFDGEFWFEGKQLPNHINIADTDPRIVKLKDPRPYMQHGYVVDRYASHQVKSGATHASAVGQIEQVGGQANEFWGMDDDAFWMGDADWMSWDGQSPHPGHDFASKQSHADADAENTSSTSRQMSTQAQPQ